MPKAPKTAITEKKTVRIDITGSGHDIGKSRIAAVVAAALRDAVSPEVDIEVHCACQDFNVASSRAMSLGIGRGQIDVDAIIIVDNDDTYVKPETPALEAARYKW